jgi:hypothetical protein
MDRLAHEDLASEAAEKLVAARQKLVESYEYFQQSDVQESCDVLDCHEAACMHHATCHPKLGQLLVASGLLTLSEIQVALRIQSGMQRHVHLGELLVSAGYLTQEELDKYLKLQQVIDLPADHSERWGQRLLALGLLTEDQLKVALIKHVMCGYSLRHAIIDSGWLTAEILDRIF